MLRALRPALVAIVLTLAVLLFATACASAPAARSDGPSYTLQIDNRNFEAAVVYVTRNGAALRRLSDVEALTQRSVRVPATQLGTDGSLSLSVRLRGNGGAATLPAVRLQPDRSAVLVIESIVSRSRLSLVPQ